MPERLYSTVVEREAFEDPWASAPVFDAEGNAVIDIPVPALAEGEDRLPYRYTLTVRARDDQKTFANASAAFFLSKVEVLGTARFSAAVVKKGAEAQLNLRASTLSGKVYGATQGQVEFVLRRADGSEKPLGTRSFTTAANGVAREQVPTCLLYTSDAADE